MVYFPIESNTPLLVDEEAFGSPLIALMKDQVDSLSRRNIPASLPSQPSQPSLF